jgi:hypothetical protein
MVFDHPTLAEAYKFLRAIQVLTEQRDLSVNSFSAAVYVMGEKTAVVVPIAVDLVRDLLNKKISHCRATSTSILC